MRRYLIIQRIKSLKDMFVVQAAHIAEEVDMTVENRWSAYTEGHCQFHRKEQQLSKCFAAIEDYQLVLEHKDNTYGVVSGDLDGVVSAGTNHWPVASTIIASPIDSSGIAANIDIGAAPVSYTHLTLPTICSV